MSSTTMGYEFKSAPYGHQLQEFQEHRNVRAWGLLWEMGTGKTKVVIDQAASLYAAGEIDCILVVAPEGVHRNWVTDQIPTHLPDRFRDKLRCFVYQTEKATTKWHQQEVEDIVSHPGLLVVAMTYDAVTTEPLMERDKISGRRKTVAAGGKRFLWDLLSARKCFFISDESRRIKNPKADRTKVVVKAGPYAPYRRLLNGTPVPNGPFDIYSQIQFLDPNFWNAHGCGTFTAFKQRFGIFKKGQVRDGSGNLREFDQLLGYRDLDFLQTILKTITSRVTKDEVLTLPPKLYSRYTFEMTATQAKIYQQLQEDYLAFLETGEMIAAPLALTRLLRFQQVTSGFLPVDDSEEPFRDIGKVNPRMDLVEEIAQDIPHKAIYWARFNRTVDKLMEMLKRIGRTPVRYDGMVGTEERADNEARFQKGDADCFVAKEITAGDGLNLQVAKTAMYVEPTWDLAARLQSEDRLHRIGQEHPVNYIDIAALGTVDEKIIACLRKKLDIADQITGDAAREWMQPI